MRRQDHFKILLEHMNDKFDLMMEYVREIPAIKQDISEVKGEVATIKRDLMVVKTVVSDNSRDIAELKIKINA